MKLLFDRLIAGVLLVVMATLSAAADQPEPAKPAERIKPLKVYILAGQSNMQGHARVSTFDSMADDPKTAPLLKEMRNKDGKPRSQRVNWLSIRPAAMEAV